MSQDSHDNTFIYILGLVIAVAAFLIPSSRNVTLERELEDLQEKYEELSVEHEELQFKYEHAFDVVGPLEDDLAILYCYFDNDEDVSFDSAKTSFEHINDVISPLIYPY